MDKAYDDGCDYFYQCGDDIEFLDKKWVSESIKILKENHDIGVTGPYEKLQRRVLTQSFVSRKHKEIFGYFFPPEIINWYCDNWMTEVYKMNYFFPLYNRWCINMGGPERYEIIGKSTREKKHPMIQICQQIVQKDKHVLETYIKKNNISFDLSKIQKMIYDKKKEEKQKNATHILKKYKQIMQEKFGKSPFPGIMPMNYQ